MTDSYYTLRGNAHLGFDPPDNPESGHLWVEASTMKMYVYDPNNLGNPAKSEWVGITSSQNTGSITYVGDRAPLLSDIYENLDALYPGINISDDKLDPLPGTLWFDTYNKVLKIWYVDSDKNGQWIGITTSHYMSEAVSAKVNSLLQQVELLENEVEDLTERLTAAGG